MSAQTTFISQAQHIGISAAKADSRFSRIYRGMLASAGFAAFVLVSAPALAATAPSLGILSTYALTANTLTNTNPFNITGDYCRQVLAGAIPSTGNLTGVCTADPLIDSDQTAALGILTTQPCFDLGAGPIALNTADVGSGAGVFPPGCYSTAGAMNVAAGAVTLSGPGVYIFKSGGTLGTTAGTDVVKTAGACEADVFWAPTGGTTLNGTTFLGSILSANAITVNSGNTISGRLLGTSGGAVTTSTSSIAVPTCTTVYPSPVPTLSEWAMITFALLIAGFGLQMMRRRRLA